jgi:1,4-alpha-glucan branching enzyme
MGWMHDTLQYVTKDPVHRRFHHNDLTFPLVYAFAENFILPLSHDEVVHGKGSLWGKMPGDPWQKAANLRLLYAHLVGHPGKKLLFMGAEYGQVAEWNHDAEIEWHLREVPLHAGVFEWLRAVLHLYRDRPALANDRPEGFYWIDFADSENSVVSYVRESDEDRLVFVFNFTPVPRSDYRIGVPEKGRWRVVLNSDEERFGGSGAGTMGTVGAEKKSSHGQPASLPLYLPPLGALVLEQVKG